MRRQLTTFLMLITAVALGQPVKNEENSWKPNWINRHLSVEIPSVLGFEWNRVIGNNHYARQLQSSIFSKGYSELAFSGFGLGIQSQGRLLGVAWKDKIGIETGICFYRKQLDFDRYYQHFVTAYPNYYVQGTQPWDKSYGMDGNINDIEFFSGFNWGVYYNQPLGKFILQPHINVCFSNWNLNNEVYFTRSTFKERGSNNTLNADIATAIRPDRGAYFAQLWLIYRSLTREDLIFEHVKSEFAFRIEAGYIPYSYTETISTWQYGYPEVQHIFTGNANQFYFNAGFLITGGRFLYK